MVTLSIFLLSLFLSVDSGAQDAPPKSKFFRKSSTIHTVVGILHRRNVVQDDVPGHIPYFTDYTNRLDYRITDNSLEECAMARDGEIMRLQGEFFEEPTRRVDIHKCDKISSEALTTRSGSEFSRVSGRELLRRGVKNVIAFGEAWKGPDELAWGDIAGVFSDGAFRIFLTIPHRAKEFCDSIGARLPTKTDFENLQRALSDKGHPSQYRPEILPNLFYSKDGRDYSYFFWSSTYGDHVWMGKLDFDGLTGNIGWDLALRPLPTNPKMRGGAFRCVASDRS